MSRRMACFCSFTIQAVDWGMALDTAVSPICGAILRAMLCEIQKLMEKYTNPLAR